MPTKLGATVAIIEENLLPAPGDAAKLESLVRHALTAEKRTGEWEISIALVSDDELRGLHRDFMGLDSVTDIMTFPYGGDALGGDIAISVDRAAEQAPEFGLSAWEEIRFLAVHGVLHLCGWDDGNDEARRRMLARQAEIVESWELA